MLKTKVTKLGSLQKIAKNIRFGTAVGLTRTAQDGQKASRESMAQTFTIRGNWTQPSNKFGIRITPARKDTLTAKVHTAADWLKIHEEGGTKTPKKRALAIPTENIRRNKRQIIPKAQRPGALKAKGQTFVLQTKSGPVLFQRKGKGKRGKIVALYNLEPKATIKKQSTFYEPINATVRAKIHENVKREIKKALSS